MYYPEHAACVQRRIPRYVHFVETFYVLFLIFPISCVNPSLSCEISLSLIEFRNLALDLAQQSPLNKTQA